MIRLRNVTKRYPGLKHAAVDSLDLDVAEGSVSVLLGPSGCGKSTTLRMINRLIEPDEGLIEVAGRDVREIGVEELRRGIGYAIQGVGLFPHWTVHENIGTVPWLLGWDKERISMRVAELLELVGLDPERYAGAFPDELSGGEAQRVGVARALAADPPVLLMDEPFGAVDPLTRDRLQREFLAIQARLCKTVVFVTHDIDEAVRLGDHIAVMREGALVQQDTPERLLAYPADEFVGGFVGGNRALKRLSLVPLAEVMGPPVNGSEPARSEPPVAGAIPAGVDSVPVDANLQDTLSVLLQAGADELPVTGDGGEVVGSISLERLMDHFRKPV